MLSESSRKNKENLSRFDTLKQNSSLVQSTISNLRQEIAALQQEKSMIEKQWAAEVDVLALQLSEYKKKFSSLTDKYLIETFTKEKHTCKQPRTDYEKMARQKQVLYEQEQQSKRKLEEELKKMIDENAKQKKQITILRYEKEKSMEIGLIEKIEYEEKNKLLEEEVKSKKNIIANFKKELEKAYSDREQLGKRERTVEQKSKELDCFSRQVNEYNRLSQAKLNQKVSRLTQQNEFLKNYVKKLQKIADKECECELKDQKVKQNLFQIKRQLALAKVRLGESYLKSKQLPKKRSASPSSSDQQPNDKKYRR